MQIDKHEVVDVIRAKGDQRKTDQARQELPDTVDTDQHTELMDKYEIGITGRIAGLGGKLTAD